MATNSRRAVPVVLTTEQKMDLRDATTLRHLKNFILEIVEDDTIADDVARHVGDGFELDASRVKRLVGHQEKIRVLNEAYPVSVENLALDELLALTRKAVESIDSRLLLEIRHLGDCGEVNSTCSMTRAFAAFKMAARRELAASLSLTLTMYDNWM